MDQTEAQKPVQLSDLQKLHHEYDEKLLALAEKPYLSADEELEETRLKKLKLQIKDQITNARPAGDSANSKQVA